MHRAAIALALAGLGVMAGRAGATPGSDPTAGRAVFTGATMPNATSIDLDPAALGLKTSNEVYIAAMSVLDQYSIHTMNLDINTGALAPGQQINDVELSPGGMIAAIGHFKDRATAGFELRSAAGDSFPSNQTALQYQTLGGGERKYTGAVGLSVKLADWWYFGIGLAGEVAYLHLHYARDTALANGHGPNGIDSDCGGSPCGVGNPLATERYDVNARSQSLVDSIVVNLGMAFRFAPDSWIAIAYHAPPGLSVQTELDGTMDVRQAPRDGTQLLHGGATVEISQPASLDLEVRARVASDLDLHAGGRFIDLSRLSQLDVQGYDSVFAYAKVPGWTEIPRGFHNVYSFWGGVEQPDNGEPLRFGARLGLETSSVDQDATSALAIGPTSYTLDLGAQLRLPSFVIQVSYGLQYFPTVDVTNSRFDPRATIQCIDSGFDYNTAACAAARDGYGIPSAAGDYGKIEHALRVGLRHDFD